MTRRYPEGVEPAFCYAVELTLGAEGVFSDHAWDPGGATKYGVTEAVARRHGYAVGDLTLEQAVGIYHADYWRRPGLHELTSWHVAAELFDSEVNTGRGALLAQRAMVHNLLASEAEVGGVDGKWGPKTRAALNGVTRRYERHLMGALAGELYRHYHAIRPARPELFGRAIRGWMIRVWPDLPKIDRTPWEWAAREGRKP